MKPDYSLYLVTDRMRMSTRTLGEAVEQAVIGGRTLVQLREKEIPALDFYMLALEIKKITDRYGIPLIINDRIDIAMATGADGVHIGQRDIPADIARKVIGGISRENAMLFRPMGVDGLAVVSAVIAQPDIKKSAADLKSLFLGKEVMNEH